MDRDARPVCRHVEHASISAKALTVDAAGDTYQITGADPAVALRFLSSCNGTLSTADICEKHSIPTDIAGAIVESCREIELLYLNLPPLADVAADVFLNILRQRYAVWNTELFSQLLWRFLLSGKAKPDLVNGWLLESYHFIRGASARLAYATSLSHDDRVTPYFLDHHLEEYDHYNFFEDALRRRNVNFAGAVPLPSTEAIINFARMAARRGPLHYMACSGLLESSGSDTMRASIAPLPLTTTKRGPALPNRCWLTFFSIKNINTARSARESLGISVASKPGWQTTSLIRQSVSKTLSSTGSRMCTGRTRLRVARPLVH